EGGPRPCPVRRGGVHVVEAEEVDVLASRETGQAAPHVGGAQLHVAEPVVGRDGAAGGDRPVVVEGGRRGDVGGGAEAGVGGPAEFVDPEAFHLAHDRQQLGVRGVQRLV